MQKLKNHLLAGQVIPALPLTLNQDGSWNEQYQRALVRYYCDAGAGGIAAGVHSTQFEIRNPDVALYKPVLRTTIEVINIVRETGRYFAAIAGVAGRTDQAAAEADTARALGYDAVLLSMAALNDQHEDAIIEHCRRVAHIVPIIGFYLQPAVGGRIFSYRFWRRFMEIENLIAVKTAPFNRYFTWDVVRACMDAQRDDVALYTGNDDNIVIDLLTPFEWQGKQRWISGGLLGHWGVWTRAAVKLLNKIKQARSAPTINIEWLTIAQQVTDMNAALFDTAHSFAGCIPGIMEVLRRQGLAPSARILDPAGKLSPGQAEELDRVCAAWPHLTDDRFVSRHIEKWLAPNWTPQQQNTPELRGK